MFLFFILLEHLDDQGLDITIQEIGYYLGYVCFSIAELFFPYSKIGRIENVSDLVRLMGDDAKAFVKGARNAGKVTVQVIGKSFENFISFLRNGKKNFPELFKRIFKRLREWVESKIGKILGKSNRVGSYTTKIKWGILDVEVRPFKNLGYWGKRVKQKNPRVDAYELKINPNNESFYVPKSDGGYVQFENLKGKVLEDGKLLLKPNNSMYRVYDKPLPFLQNKILKEAIRQVQAAKGKGLKVTWLVSDRKSVDQLSRFFKENEVEITVKFLAE